MRTASRPICYLPFIVLGALLLVLSCGKFTPPEEAWFPDDFSQKDTSSPDDVPLPTPTPSDLSEDGRTPWEPPADANRRERATGAMIYVAPGGTGNGTPSAPLGTINAALQVAQPGDAVTIRPGMYHEEIVTVRDGTVGRPIIIHAEKKGDEVLVTRTGRLLLVNHSNIVIEDIVFDGQFGGKDAVNLRGDKKENITLRRIEVRNSGRDCIDVSNQRNVLIEFSAIHHCLDWEGQREDAHGVTGGAVQNVTIRNTDIYSFSGDAIQFDPDRSSPGWNNILISRCRLWLEPLAQSVNGFSQGTVPGENAVDTKVWSGPTADQESYRPKLYIRDTEAWGFKNGLISTMAAFNLKEKVDVVLNRVTIRDSEVALRIRGQTSSHPLGSSVKMMNVLIYNSQYAIRYEDNIRYPIHVWNVTIGSNVATPFLPASTTGNNLLDIRNLLILAPSLPSPAQSTIQNSLAVNAVAFVNVPQNDYRLAPGSSAINAGQTIEDIKNDLQGIERPQAGAFDIGAHEFKP